MHMLNSAYRYYNELAETYGPVFSMRYGSRRVVVINRHQVRIAHRTKPSVKIDSALVLPTGRR